MSKTISQDDYDAEYYRSHCGPVPYSRSEPQWKQFFDEVARRLDEALAPKRVFDAGCAIGFLIEALRLRGIEAFGRDYSPYAIEQVPVGLKPYCEVGSIADEIAGRYDLITCVEVLEHMPSLEGTRAISRMCQAAPLVLFSSTPRDFTEPTHINVQPPLHWLRLFAECGFGPRAGHDATYLAPWAMLLERRPDRPSETELLAFAQLIAARVRLADLETSLTSAKETQAGFEKCANGLTGELMIERGRVQELAGELKIERGRVQQLADELSAESRRAEGLARELAATIGMVERLAAIETSTLWRLSLPLRIALARLPRVRSLLRRGAKGLHWTITGQPAARLIESVRQRRFSPGGPKTSASLGAQIGEVPPVEDQFHSRGGQADYLKWIEAYDRLQPGETSIIRAYISTLPAQPKVSIIVPLYNTPANVLEEMIASVRVQAYENWELCLADDASEESNIQAKLQCAATEDARIKLVFSKANGGISAASNAALELASGDYIALLDHDDVLAPHALATMVVAINQHPDSDIFYSDEDKLDAEGRRYGAYFKPDWNPELIYGQNFISHLGVYRTSLVRSVGGFRLGFEGSQDYDLTLRCVAATTSKIVHVPHILYHWRLHPGAQTFSSTQLARATSAARCAIKEHLEQLGEEVDVVDGCASFHRVVRKPQTPWPRVSVIIPTRDHPDILAECLRGLVDCTDYPDLDIIVADNGSVEENTKRLLAKMSQRGVRVVDCAGPFNYPKINNRAIRHAKGEILLLLNNDVSMTEPQWLKEMVIYLLKQDVGAVGAKLFYPDGTVQHGGVVLGLGGVAGHLHLGAPHDSWGYFGWLGLARDVAGVTAACMAVRRSVFEQIGGFDEENLAIAFNDVDLCIRIREAGYRIIWTPYAQLTHHESKSRGLDNTEERRRRFEREVRYMRARWGDLLDHDPFWSSNLSLYSSEPIPAFPPRRTLPWRESPR
ncbi:GT2 family glycosyltransferase/SAM-dependent methyltransferase [Bradyrhizobium sp. F1.13.1]